MGKLYLFNCRPWCRSGEQATDRYEMKSDRRGLCIVISNKNFSPPSQLNRRVGSEHDMLMLRQIFTQLGFEVAIHTDVTAEHTFGILAEGLRLVRDISHSYTSAYALMLIHASSLNKFLPYTLSFPPELTQLGEFRVH